MSKLTFKWKWNRQCAMAKSNVEKEIKCVLHWFRDWSAFQRTDFMSNLVEKAVPQKVSTLFDAMTMLNMQDKPPSLFKCQLKLFDQWFCEWTDYERNQFMNLLEESDSEFVQIFNAQVAATSGQSWQRIGTEKKSYENTWFPIEPFQTAKEWKIWEKIIAGNFVNKLIW